MRPALVLTLIPPLSHLTLIPPLSHPCAQLYTGKEMISKVPFFKRASLSFMDNIIAALRREIYLPDDVVIPHNKTNTEMYFISNGKRYHHRL